jgi:hypothetical protein
MPFAQVTWDTPKVCLRCKVAKHRSEFHKQKQSKNAVRSHCKPCSTIIARERSAKWRGRDPDGFAVSARYASIKWKYGISQEQFEEMLARQCGVCAICSRKEESKRGRLFVDHCHSTGVVRGLLCSRCNSGLGNFRDSPEIMDNARAYLMAARSLSNVRV